MNSFYLSHCSFNTSHVVVYRIGRIGKMKIVFKFQYISCCCLSGRKESVCNIRKVSIHLMLLFIKIKRLFCSQILSFNTSHVVVYLIFYKLFSLCFCCFNTSHVVVYRQRTIACVAAPKSFNTSHVVVYLHKRRGSKNFNRVSIHLMLLFILRPF